MSALPKDIIEFVAVASVVILVVAPETKVFNLIILSLVHQ